MKLKRVLSVILFIAFCFVAMCCFPLNHLESRASTTPALEKHIEKMREEDYVPVAVIVQEVDQKLIEEQLFREIGINRDFLSERLKDDEITIDEVQRYIRQERDLYSSAQYHINQNVWESISFLETKEIYISLYSPYLFLEVKKADIPILLQEEGVVEIDYLPPINVEECGPVVDPLLPLPNDYIPMNDYFEIIGAKQMRDTYGYTGAGIIIGQIEPGVPNTSLTCFQNADIHIRSGCTNVQTHASQVASILVSQQVGSLGIVPDATLYCASVSTASDVFESIEWLITIGVNIINRSAGAFGTDDGNYTAYSRWLDHLAINHSVHLIAAAGNHSNGEDHNYLVPHSSMGYNTITVGNITESGRYSGSRYQQASGYADKPEICSFGTDVLFPINGSHATGTSYSTPMVTGVVAQLCDYKPGLLVLQDLVKAIICASVSHSGLMYTTSMTSDYNECGAGLVNATSSRYTMARNFYKESSFAANSSSGSYKTYTFTTTNDTLSRVCLTWLKYNKYSSSCGTTYGSVPNTEGTLANLDIIIYDSNGAVVASSSLTSGNVELVQFVPVANETYTVYVILTGTSTKKTYFGLAWW